MHFPMNGHVFQFVSEHVMSEHALCTHEYIMYCRLLFTRTKNILIIYHP